MEPKLPWWKDGEQLRGILSDLGKWILLLIAAWKAHDAAVDNATNAVKIGEVQKQVDARPLMYGERK